MKTDSKTREGFHSIEILLKNKPEVIKKVIKTNKNVQTCSIQVSCELIPCV